MKWVSVLSEKNILSEAIEECSRKIKRALSPKPPDFLCAFISMNYDTPYEKAHELLLKNLPAKNFIGCSTGGIIGEGKEVEQRPAINLVAASLPNVFLHPFSVQESDLPDLDGSPRLWENLIHISKKEIPQFLLLSDPFSFSTDKFLLGMDYAFPSSKKVGGLASGAMSQGQNALFLNKKCLHSGLVGMAFTGDIRLETIVAQGCRPIGTPFRITDSQDNILLEIDDKPPLTALKDLARSIPPKDQELLGHSLFLGLGMDSQNDCPEMGDFLIRNIIGVDNDHGALAIGALLRKGQIVQFHLRDAKTSSDDLKLMLSRHEKRKANQGAFLFSCMGRGQYLYKEPHHDSRVFQERMGPIPLGGFFCNGEIGPLDNTTFVHGYTSCFGLFGPKK